MLRGGGKVARARRRADALQPHALSMSLLKQSFSFLCPVLLLYSYYYIIIVFRVASGSSRYTGKYLDARMVLDDLILLFHGYKHIGIMLAVFDVPPSYLIKLDN
jgi:hypothetical protein